jgi:hypothetical protein
MFLTVNGDNGSETFSDCFDYLQKTLENHYLLTQDERQSCVESIEKLKQVFSRFKKPK